ncbi:MAG: FAD-dependent oxidoreductase [Gemmatimonadota bacterium]|nr:FAD-dependent oxidoreductase [Gemmatimonadota bacterium]
MRVGVVGGGVIGLATAWYLKKAGAEPFVVEAGVVGGGCSAGNLGWVCPSISTPVPAPGLTWKSLMWALRRDGPLYVRPAAVPGLLPWLLRFRSHCNRADWEHGVGRLAELNARTMELYEGLAAEGVDFEFERVGALIAFRDRGKAALRREELAAVAAVGESVWWEVDGAEVHELEPMLRPGFSRGFFVESDCHVRPESLTAGLGAGLRGRGVEILEGTKVVGFRGEGRRVTGMRTTAGDLDGDAVVLAVGASTGVLTRMLGWRIPLTAGKGYSVTIKEPRNQLRQPLYLGDAHVGLTPFKGALRFGGTMELSGVNERLDRARVRSLRRVVWRDVDIPEARDGGREWVGMRPMLPDTLPVMGRVPSRENVYVNTGHQMSGVTLGLSSGRALAGLMVEGGSEMV